MPLSEHNWERFFQQQVESNETLNEKENKDNPSVDQATLTKQTRTVVKKIKSTESHEVALKLLDNKEFEDKLKNIIGTLIVNKEKLTRIDFVMDTTNNMSLLNLYGMTKEHFKDLSNGNLTSFELKPDGDYLSICFKKSTGEPAIRPLDNKKLADILNVLFESIPDLAPQNLQKKVKIK
jgi:hypothetical protein